MDVVIVGAGGHGRVVLDILRAQNLHRPVAFIDGDPTLAGTTVDGLPVVGSINLLSKIKAKAKGAIVAIGDNRTRVSYARKLADQGLTLVTAIHPNANVSPTAKIGKNVVVAAGACVCAHVELGDSTIVNTGAVVDHESILSEGVHICPGALLAGRVRVEAGAFVGLGAKIIQCLTVGSWSTIGAGAVIIKDVQAGCTLVGVPGRVVRLPSSEQAA